jgi:hypothetical protein
MKYTSACGVVFVSEALLVHYGETTEGASLEPKHRRLFSLRGGCEESRA